MPTLSAPAEFEIPKVPVRKFSVAEYHGMIAAGILTENDSVELLEGWIVPQMPHNPLHDSTIQFINKRLGPLLPSSWYIRIQSAITLEDSEPEPDVAVVQGTSRTFRLRHPEPADIGLVIEVSDSTLIQDRPAKYAVYASAGIREYWIINLEDLKVDVFWQPRTRFGKAQYRKKAHFRSGQDIPLQLATHRMTVRVDDLIDGD
jgi:Uma2 family endonuclease